MSTENVSENLLPNSSQAPAAPSSGSSRIVHLKPNRPAKGTGAELFVAGVDLILVLVCNLMVEIVPDKLATEVILIWAVVFIAVNFGIRR